MSSQAPQSPHPTQSSRILALDGLRGLALLCVLASHLGLPMFGGSVIMFVLSGFLITSLLLNEFDQRGRIAIRSFYARRAQRLLPALIVMLAVVNTVVTLTRSQDAQALMTDTLYTLAYLNNWSQMSHPSSLLAHLWSLSIQEQFYFVWPLVLMVLLRTRRAVLLAVCLMLAVGSWALRVLMLNGGASIAEIYLPTMTRVDSVFLGCALGVLISMPISARVRRWAQSHAVAVSALALCGVALLLAHLMAYRYDNLLTYVVGLPMISLCTCGLIAAACLSGRPRGVRMLAHPALVHVGRISYSAYLWHYPLLMLAPHNLAGVAVMGGLILGHVSYRIIEAPLLKRHPQ